MTTRDELVVVLAGRYAVGSRVERGRMLDEFAALTLRANDNETLFPREFSLEGVEG